MSGTRTGRFIKTLISLAVVGGCAWGIWVNRGRIEVFGTGKDEEEEQDLALFEVHEGPLTIGVTESGTVKPREQVIIKNEVEGRATILFLIEEGKRVAKGDLLVELDVSQLQDQQVDQEIRVQNAEASFIESRENLEVTKNQAKSDVSKAELTLRFAKEDLTKYEEGEYPNELKDQEARITLSEEELQRSKDKLAWSKVLFKEKYLAETELKADELAAKKAELDLELAVNKLDLLKEFTYKRNIDELKSEVEQSQMALERTERRASADVVQAEAQLRARESEYKRQKSKLEKIKEQIVKGKIYAPMDGLVVYATSAKANWRGNQEPLDEGQEVRERQELIYLPTADTFMAEVKIHESNLDKVVAGLPVRLTVDALPGMSFEGSVYRIAPLPDAQSVWMNPDLKVYRTEIFIDGGGNVLKTGMSCRAEIIAEHYPSVFYVPVQCVVRIENKPTVFLGGETGPVPHEVTVGLDNNSMIHIKSGLAPGDKVLLTPPLTNASAVGSKIMSEEEMDQLETAGVQARKARATAEANDKPPPSAGPKGAGPPGAGMSPEQLQKMRERMKNMTPEERAEMRKKWGGRRREGGGQGRPRPAPERGAGDAAP